MFRGVRHYAEQRLGLGRSATADRVRLHRALRRFPLLREAYVTDVERLAAGGRQQV